MQPMAIYIWIQQLLRLVQPLTMDRILSLEPNENKATPMVLFQANQITPADRRVLVVTHPQCDTFAFLMLVRLKSPKHRFVVMHAPMLMTEMSKLSSLPIDYSAMPHVARVDVLVPDFMRNHDCRTILQPK